MTESPTEIPLIAQFPHVGLRIAPPDYMIVTDPETGLPVAVPQSGPPVTSPDGQEWPSQWHLDDYCRALRRELEGVEHKLRHLDDPVLAFQHPPTAEERERERVSLEGTREHILGELARLEPTDEKQPKRRKR
jgi:hypothetical protein